MLCRRPSAAPLFSGGVPPLPTGSASPAPESPTLPAQPDDPDYFHIPSEWQTFVDVRPPASPLLLRQPRSPFRLRAFGPAPASHPHPAPPLPSPPRLSAQLDTDPNISFEHLGSAPLSWEEARALRKKREAEDPLKRLEKFSPMFKELFDVSDEQLAQLSQVAVALHNNKRARDPAEGMDVKEQEEALRRAMEEIRGDRADRRADPAAEKLLHSLEHNRSIPYQVRGRRIHPPREWVPGWQCRRRV